MSNGGYKGASPARETSPEQYPGVWELTEQFQAQADGNWPFQETDCAPKSLRLNDGSGGYLNRTPSSPGNKIVWTFSFWIKLNKVDGQRQIFTVYSDSNNDSLIKINSNGYLEIYNYRAGAYKTQYISNARFRDPSAFYNFVISCNGSTSLNAWVNGVALTFSTSTGPDGNNWLFNTTNTHQIGRYNTTANSDFQLAETHWVDGQALTPDAFTFIDGQGILQPKRFTGDYSSGPVYSNFGSSSATLQNGNWGQVFDGSKYMYGGSGASNGPALANGSLSFSPVGLSGRVVKAGVRGGSNKTYTVNGTAMAFGSSSAEVAYIDLGSVQPITSIVGTSTDSSIWAQFYYIEVDGVVLTDASVGRNSFRLDFSDSSSNAALGKDSSGVGNDWTPNNLYHFTGTEPVLPSNGYNDFTLGYYLNGNPPLFLTKEQTGSGIDRADQITHGSSTGTTWAVNDVLQWAIDWSGGTAKIWFGRNNTWYSGDPSAGTNPSVSGVTDKNWFLALAYNSSDFELQVPASASYTLPTGYSYWGGVSLGTWKTSGTNQGGCPDVFTTAIPRTGKVYIEAIIKGGTTTYACVGLQNHGETSVTTDVFVDTPVNGNEASTGAGGERRGNYCNWNPLKQTSGTYSHGNLQIATSSGNKHYQATFGLTSGKWYWEVTPTAGSTPGMIGIALDSKPLSNNLNGDSAMCYYSVTGYKQGGNTSGVDVSYGATYTYGDVIGVALDLDSGTKTLTFYKNGSSQGVAFNPDPTLGSWHPAVSAGSSSNTTTFVANFGQRSFSYAPPAGFSPVATSFLPEPSESAMHPHKGVDVALFNANSGVSQFVPLSFSPDLVWTKHRIQNYEPQIFDKVRGDDQEMSTNVARASRNLANSFTFNDDGFTLPGSNNNANYGTGGSVAWAWDAGESTTTIAAGSLNSAAYNQTDWSGSTTTTNIATNTGNDLASVFDGNLANGTRAANNGGTGTLQWSSGTIQGNVRVYTGLAGTQGLTYYNGSTSTTIASVNNGWNDLGNIDLTRLDFVYSGGNITFVNGIELDGKLLVQTGITLANVPSIATTVRANPSYGFSISKASVAASLTGGPTVGHLLQKKPEFIIGKNIDSTIYWYAYHKDLTNEHYLIPHLTSGEQHTGAVWGNHDSLDANQFQIGNNTPASMWIPSGTHDCIFYAWTGIEGFSKFGSFVNPSGQGAFVFLGFKPALIFAKCATNISSSNNLGDWIVKDSSRSPFNNPSDGNTLVWNEAYAEDGYYAASQAAIDILSNGFKIRHAGSSPLGDAGRRYVFAAWAENPFASNNRAC